MWVVAILAAHIGEQLRGDVDVFAPGLLGAAHGVGERLVALLLPLLPRYDREGKSYLTIAIGCTGGQHRSVYVAERLAQWLRAQGKPVGAVGHRDLRQRLAPSLAVADLGDGELAFGVSPGATPGPVAGPLKDPA